jgi:transposase
VLDGPINGEAFLAWVEQFLAPTLQPGQIIFADRLGSHKVAGVREALGRTAQLSATPDRSDWQYRQPN